MIWLHWQTRALGAALALVAAALAAALVLILVNQAHVEANQRRLELNQARIAELQYQEGRLVAAAAAGRLEDTQLQLLVRALQQQVRRLGGTPLDQPPSSRTTPAGDGRSSGSGTPSPSSRSTPSPAPTRTPRPTPRPSPSPSPQPTICVPTVCVYTIDPQKGLDTHARLA